MPSHTPEPWESSGHYVVRSGTLVEGVPNCEVAACDGIGDGLPKSEQKANAAHIVSCVNALAGMNPEAVAGVVNALESCAAQMHMLDCPAHEAKARKALAALRGEGGE